MTEKKISEVERLINSGVLDKSVIDRLSKSQIDELQELLQKVEARCEKCGEVKPMYPHQMVCDNCIAKEVLRRHRKLR